MYKLHWSVWNIVIANVQAKCKQFCLWPIVLFAYLIETGCLVTPTLRSTRRRSSFSGLRYRHCYNGSRDAVASIASRPIKLFCEKRATVSCERLHDARVQMQESDDGFDDRSILSLRGRSPPISRRVCGRQPTRICMFQHLTHHYISVN